MATPTYPDTERRTTEKAVETAVEKQEREAAEYKAWLKALKPGDEVAVYVSTRFGGGSKYSIERVTERTAHHVVVWATKYSRKDGYQVRKSGGYRTNLYHIEPVTDAIRQNIEDGRVLDRTHHLIYVLNEARVRHDWSRYSMDQLRTALDHLKEVTEVLGLTPAP